MTTTADLLDYLLDMPDAERRALLAENTEAAGVALDLARAELDAAEARSTGGEPR